jgi:hypothetical protein
VRRELSTPINSEDISQVRAALAQILASSLFRSSKRYPAMLRYVVETTLQGRQEFLKERTIGIEVFGRDPAYDTNLDPVVRFSAGEVRKRIAQYYRENGSESPVEVELPLGSYVPRFYLRLGTVQTFPSPLGLDLTAEPALPAAEESAPSRRPFARRGALAALLLFALLAAGLYLYRQVRNTDPVRAVWEPILQSSDPVLISAGRPHAADEAPDPPRLTIGERILQPDFRLSITTASAIARICGYLQAHDKPFHIQDAFSHSLADLHERPVVLVNANDNKWTLLLLKGMRFEFKSDELGTIITDTQHPENRAWKVDFRQPYLEQTVDYAIVSSFHSSTTNGPVIVVAGISSNGTDAAGEFIVSKEGLAQLRSLAPQGWQGGNFEAVLKVEVVGGNNGATTIIASQFW